MSYSLVKKLRKECLIISNIGCDGNLQSTFSSLDIMWVLYDRIINFSTDSCMKEDRDYFILSKGQSSLGLYTILAEKEMLDKEELKSFCRFDSSYGMQADRSKFNKGPEVSTGSLGHGFPMAVGIAMANRIKKSQSKVYVLVGDGEFNEGTMWEAAVLASSRKLDNLCVIIDDNDSIGRMIDMGNMKCKLEAFGFLVADVNGHNHDEIYQALLTQHVGQPLAIIAHTVRGYGSKTMMEDNKWFHRSPNKEELDMLLREVEEF